jgi:hypothetical protein
MGRWIDMFKYLSAASFLVTLALCGCSSDGGESKGGAGSSNNDSGGSATNGTDALGASCGADRQKLTCGELKTKIEADSKSIDFETKVTLGLWTEVPDELKVLPASAELCGSVDLLNQGLVASDLDCDALRSYYRKVFEDDLGCKPFNCETETHGSQSQLRCSCAGGDHFGQLVTSPDTQYYLLSY